MQFSHHALAYFVDDMSEVPFDSAAVEADSEVTTITTDTLSIGDVRTLIDTAYAKPFEKPSRTLVVKAGSIGIEAQHALLKILEEPPVTTKFILVLPHGATLLPTVLSRIHVVECTHRTSALNPEVFESFLSASIASRLERIASMTKDKDSGTQDALARGLANWVASAKGVSPECKAKLLWCVSTLPMRGAAKKMLWEEIALTLPLP